MVDGDRRKAAVEMQVETGMEHVPHADHGLCPGLCHGSEQPSPSCGSPLHVDLAMAVGVTEWEDRKEVH